MPLNKETKLNIFYDIKTYIPAPRWRIFLLVMIIFLLSKTFRLLVHKTTKDKWENNEAVVMSVDSKKKRQNLVYISHVQMHSSLKYNWNFCLIFFLQTESAVSQLL